MFKLKFYTGCRKGFTLTEMLVVIAIIGILAAVSTFYFEALREKGRDNRRISDINRVAAAINSYAADNGRYPSATTYAGLTTILATPPNNSLSSPPEDPRNQGIYVYHYRSSGANDYYLWACLEQSHGSTSSSYSDCNDLDGDHPAYIIRKGETFP